MLTIYSSVDVSSTVHGAMPVPTVCIHGEGLNKLQEGLQLANC